jgi:ATP-dependent Clp protease ATP-binding subunit ClpC
MFERFTDKARQCVVLAQEEARLLDHNYIGTEHLLLGLAREADGIAAHALQRLGITLDAVRADVTTIIGAGPAAAPSGHIPFTPRAKKVLELSLREALQLGHNYIGTEHILLGLVREGEGVAAQILVGRGADLARVREVVVGLLPSGAARPAGAGRRTPAADEVLESAAQLAGGGPVGTHHLLEALARTEDAVAARALVALGVDVDVLATTLDDLGTAGTRDETPEQAALRSVELRVDDDALHVIVRDPGTVARARTVLNQLGGESLSGENPLAAPLAGIWHAVRRTLDDLDVRLSMGDEGDEGGLRRAVRRAIQTRLRLRGRQAASGSAADRPEE